VTRADRIGPPIAQKEAFAADRYHEQRDAGRIMPDSNRPGARRAVLFAVAMSAAATGAWAAPQSGGDDWQYSATVYLWGAGIQGETAGGSKVDVSFSDLISNLNLAFMGAFEARKSRWSALADVVYLNVGADGGGVVPVPVAPDANVRINIKADVKTKGWVINLLGGYNLWQAGNGSLDVVAGARYLDLRLDLGLGLSGPAHARSRDFAAAGSVWDAVIGARGHFDLNRNWYVPYYLDVGTGQSDLTWQASAGLAYRFNWGAVSLVYRHAEWAFDSRSQLDYISFSGPLLAAEFRF